MTKHKNSNKGWIIFAIILGVIAFGVVFSVSLSQNSNSETSSQNQETQKSCSDVQVPYDYLETYTDTEPYTTQDCQNINLVYRKDTGKCIGKYNGILGIGGNPASFDCTISNLDSQGATFSLDIGFNVQGQPLHESQSKFIYPQQSATFSITRDSATDSCFCNEINIPTKQVCHDVIEYRDVQKQRTVTKYRTEQKCE